MKIPHFAKAGDWLVVAVCPFCQDRTVCALHNGFSESDALYAVNVNMLNTPCQECGLYGMDAFVAGRVTVDRKVTHAGEIGPTDSEGAE